MGLQTLTGGVLTCNQRSPCPTTAVQDRYSLLGKGAQSGGRGRRTLGVRVELWFPRQRWTPVKERTSPTFAGDNGVSQSSCQDRRPRPTCRWRVRRLVLSRDRSTLVRREDGPVVLRLMVDGRGSRKEVTRGSRRRRFLDLTSHCWD